MHEFLANENILTYLACAVLQPGLRSILVFDAPYAGLLQLAEVLESLLIAVGPDPVRRYQLPVSASDEDLWGTLLFPGKRTPLELRTKLFSPERNAAEMQLLTIADLSMLQQTIARSCLMLLDTPVAYVQRNGEDACWRPNQCWLAACPQERVGAVSPHLLDRFALRLSWSQLMAQGEQNLAARTQQLQEALSQHAPELVVSLPETMHARIRAAAQKTPELTDAALKRLTSYSEGEQRHHRRELMLARFAVALAQWQGVELVTEKQVNEAARLSHSTATFMPSDPVPSPEPEPDVPEARPRATGPEVSPPPLPVPEPEEREREESVHLSEPTFSNPLQMPMEPYPEDSAQIEREAASLRFPISRAPGVQARRGPVIGVEPGETLEDLALVSTLLAAARFQVLRKRKPGEPLHIKAMDLQRYRRGLIVEHLLLLVIDYTSVRDLRDFQDLFVPYLQEAYQRRAGIVIVKIGATGTCSPLRAELFSAKSILVPRVSAALEEKHGKGKPTPLAHGLHLALDHMRHVLQHGRTTVSQVTLLVLSDGRGNVPLQASRDNKLSDRPVMREGIDDALEVARKIRLLKNVETVVLSPSPRYYPELVPLLAEALGAGLDELVEGVEG